MQRGGDIIGGVAGPGVSPGIIAVEESVMEGDDVDEDEDEDDEDEDDG